MQRLTTSDVKSQNTQSIVQFIYTNRITTQHMICEKLNLSRPTVIRILKELEELGIITKEDNFFESTGGRKANAISFHATSHIAIGVEILKTSFELVALNLYGDILKSETHFLNFTNHDCYFSSLCNSILAFIESFSMSDSSILGIGIALQGLISTDGTQVVYGRILDCTGLTIEQFTKHLPYPCTFLHDAECSALSELWFAPHLKDMIFINIRSDISGALIVNRQFLQGGELKSGVFEHMKIVPKGKPCYCGQEGCFNAYCSSQALLDTGESLDSFFQNLRLGDTNTQQRFEQYLRYFAIALNNLHMFIDFDIIIGGTLSRYLIQEDIDTLLNLIYKTSAFPTNRKFVKLSKNPEFPISRGAALLYIHSYLTQLTGSYSI